MPTQSLERIQEADPFIHEMDEFSEATQSPLPAHETEVLGGVALTPTVEIQSVPEASQSVLENATDKAITDHLRTKLTVPNSLTLHATYRKDVGDEDAAVFHEVGKNGGLRTWQEQTFGSAEISALQADVTARFEQPVSERVGEEVVDTYTGAVKRPIMDISLDAHTKDLVAETVLARSTGLELVIQRLKDAQQAGVSLNLEQCNELLFDNHVVGRKMGNLLGTSLDKFYGSDSTNAESPAGTIADLYIDAQDLEKYAAIDKLVAEATGIELRTADRVARGVVNMAGHTFASGTELMHAVPNENLKMIVAQGSLSTRSQILHGATPKTQLNGAFLHMTAPATAAYEYTDSAAPTIIGIPIDTVVKHSPFLQLEGDYTGDTIKRLDSNGFYSGDSSMQYEMGTFEINDISTAPEAFRAALGATQQRTDKGIRGAHLEQGKLNNLSFAANGDAASAGEYSYPLEELHVYTSSLETVRQIGVVAPDNAEAFYARTTLCLGGDGHAVGYVKQPGMQLTEAGAIRVYAPAAAREVSFTEAHAGNSKGESTLPLHLGTIDPAATARFMNQLVKQGMSPVEAAAAGINSVNERGGEVYDLLTSFGANDDTYTKAGVTIKSVIDSMSVLKLLEINPNWLTINANKLFQPEVSEELIRAYGDRLFRDAPNDFAQRAATLAEIGYNLSPKQKSNVTAYEAIQDKKELDTQRPVNPSDMVF